MSESISAEAASAGSVEEAVSPRRDIGPRRIAARGPGRSLTVVPSDLVAPDAEAPLAERDDYLAQIELRLRELTEIERMRDLEIHRLEADVELQSSRLIELETALFHSERRANDLDRRWNELASVYEESAASLVEAGAQLEQIHRQTSYKLVLAAGRGLRRMPGLYDWLRKLTSRITALRAS